MFNTGYLTTKDRELEKVLWALAPTWTGDAASLALEAMQQAGQGDLTGDEDGLSMARILADAVLQECRPGREYYPDPADCITRERPNPRISTLTQAQAGAMTGWEFMKAVGIMDPVYRSWQHNKIEDFQIDGKTWHAYTTRGRGRYSGVTYVHLYTDIQARIVNPDGTDTGQRADRVVHYRGNAGEKIGQFREVD